jgi:hypothetical protein
MTEEEILEENKLIAHFMGYKPFDNGDKRYSSNDWYCGENIIYAQYKDLGYDRSWDWLMPVVRKIVDYCINKDEDAFVSDEYNSILDTIPLAVIEDSHKVVVEFIKYYNNEQIN